MKVRIKRIAMTCLAALFLALPLCAGDDGEAESTTSNKGKMKEGASQFFNGLKGSAHDAGDSAKKKMNAMKTPAYVGEWTFENGKYRTVFILDDDGTMTVEQDKPLGSSKWAGTYDVEKKVISFEILRENGKRVKKSWQLSFDAKKGEYIIIWSDDIPDDSYGYDFSRKTLFLYSETEAEEAE